MEMPPFEPVMPNIDVLLAAVESDDSRGYCLACGNWQFGCEPDARNYKCDSCGLMYVFGAEETLFMIDC